MLDRYATIAASDLAGAVFELLQILRTDPQLTAVACETEAEELDFARFTDAALLMVITSFSLRVRYCSIDRATRSAATLVLVNTRKSSA